MSGVVQQERRMTRRHRNFHLEDGDIKYIPIYIFHLEEGAIKYIPIYIFHLQEGDTKYIPIYMFHLEEGDAKYIPIKHMATITMDDLIEEMLAEYKLRVILDEPIPEAEERILPRPLRPQWPFTDLDDRVPHPERLPAYEPWVEITPPKMNSR